MLSFPSVALPLYSTGIPLCAAARLCLRPESRGIHYRDWVVVHDIAQCKHTDASANGTQGAERAVQTRPALCAAGFADRAHLVS